MKYSFGVLIVSFGLFVGDSNACRPDIIGIQNSLALVTLGEVFSEHRLSVLQLKESKVLTTKPEYVNADPRIDCPDKYTILYEFKFNPCKTVKAEVVSHVSHEVKVEKPVECGSL